MICFITYLGIICVEYFGSLAHGVIPCNRHFMVVPLFNAAYTFIDWSIHIPRGMYKDIFNKVSSPCLCI